MVVQTSFENRVIINTISRLTLRSIYYTYRSRNFIPLWCVWPNIKLASTFPTSVVLKPS